MAEIIGLEQTLEGWGWDVDLDIIEAVDDAIDDTVGPYE